MEWIKAGLIFGAYIITVIVLVSAWNFERLRTKDAEKDRDEWMEKAVRIGGQLTGEWLPKFEKLQDEIKEWETKYRQLVADMEALK